jgi:hypothetical protein
MTCDPHWTTYLSALMVPIVAVFGAIIAYRQWQTAQNKLKFDLFERRFAVYDAARTLLASIVTSGKATDKETFAFLSGTREAKWLLNADIADYLDKELYHKALDLQTLAAELEGIPGDDERAANVNKQREIKQWIREQYNVLDEKFYPFLQLGH